MRFVRLLLLVLCLVFPSIARADYLGSWKIDDLLTFTCTTESTANVNADADSVPTYRIYEDETGTAILTGSMAKLDDAGTLGFYSEQVTLSAANGFERGKSYSIYVTYAVSSNARAVKHGFQVEADVRVNSVGTTALDTIALQVVARSKGYKHVLCVGSGETYTTIASAKAAAVTGDLIIVFPGSYTVTDEIGKEDVDYYFCHGALVTANLTDAVFRSQGVDPESSLEGDGYGNVYGHGVFTLANAGAPKFIYDNGYPTDNRYAHYFEFDSLTNTTSTTNIFFDIESSYPTYIKAQEVAATTTNELIKNSGGYVELDCKTLYSSGGVLANTSGSSIFGVTVVRCSRTRLGGATLLTHGNSSATTIFDGFLNSTHATTNGLGVSQGQLYLLGGALKVTSGRPSLSGAGDVYVTSAFAYDKSAATATAIKLTTAESISSRIPTALDSDGLMKSNMKSVDDSTADAGLWKTFIEQLGQVRYRLGLDGSSSTPSSARPHLEQRYVRP